MRFILKVSVYRSINITALCKDFEVAQTFIEITLKMAQRVVIITGCSSGIGLDTAVLLAKNVDKKYKVYACMRNIAKKDKLIEKAGDCVDKTLFVLEMDVKSESSVNAAIKHVLDTDGRVDVLGK